VKTTFALIAAVLAIGGNVPYLLDILKQKAKPHPYTWLVWSVVSCIVFFGQLTKGAGIGALPTGASEIFTIIIFFFSLRYGFKEFSKTDTLFLVVALLGIVPWILTNDPTVAIVIAVAIDLTAFVPTLAKTWKYPSTETPVLYASNVLRHVLALFALRAYNVSTALHPLAMIVVNTLMTVFIIVRNKTVFRRKLPIIEPNSIASSRLEFDKASSLRYRT
jgi:hypothetical protein